MQQNEITARRLAVETAARIDDLAGVRVDGQLVGWMTPAGAFVSVEAQDAAVEYGRLARSL